MLLGGNVDYYMLWCLEHVIVDILDELCYIMVMLVESYVNVHCYVMCHMGSSSLYVCGCGFHMR